jgi:ketosteroid isomerase-like protein
MSRNMGRRYPSRLELTRDNCPVTPEQVVRAIYDAWLEGRSAGDLIADDMEYVNPSYAVEPGTKRGRRYLRGIRDVYDELTVTPERVEALDEGDVLVIARLTGRAGGSGVEIDTEQGYIWTVGDGLAVRFRWFRTPAEALEVAGLAD